MPGGASELERSQVVVNDQLGLIVGPSECLDPLRHKPMLVGAAGTRDLAVGDVADEQMAERVLAFAGHG